MNWFFRSVKKLNGFIFGDVLIWLAAGIPSIPSLPTYTLSKPLSHNMSTWNPTCDTLVPLMNISSQFIDNNTLYFTQYFSVYKKRFACVTYLIPAILINFIASTKLQIFLPSSPSSSSLWIFYICRVKIDSYMHALSNKIWL